MAESGIADDANYFLGSHLGFIANSGEIVLNPTHFFMCTTKYDFRFKGTPFSHAGAEPELGRNALAGALPCRNTKCWGSLAMVRGMSRINIGGIKKPVKVVTSLLPMPKMQIEVRGENEEINSFYGCQCCTYGRRCRT